MPQHRFNLRPVAHASGAIAVLMCQGEKIGAALPRPGDPPGSAVTLDGFAPVPWSWAHMQRVFAYVGAHTRHVAVARPQHCAYGHWHMVLTVVEEA